MLKKIDSVCLSVVLENEENTIKQQRKFISKLASNQMIDWIVTCNLNIMKVLYIVNLQRWFRRRATRKTILQNLEPEGKFLLIWNVMFIVSCMIAVSLDPLFFYLPVIHEDRKCLALDTKLKIIAICLRSVTNFIHLLNIILQFLCPYIDEDERKLGRTKAVTDAWPIAKRYLWSYFLIDILAILPLPQVRETFLLLNSFCVWFLKFNFNCRNWIRDLTLAKWGSFFWWMLNEDLNPTSIGTNHENFNGVLKKKKKKIGIQYISLFYLFLFF